ncbi:MAG: acyltransferase family protein, partial [Cryobacterium sp.]
MTTDSVLLAPPAALTAPQTVATVPGQASRSPRLAGLDGLRALAVLAVVLYHFFPEAIPGGFLGVDVFFVISGFLITGLLVSEHARTGRVDLRRFWQRRLKRLVPPLVPVILLGCAGAFVLGGDVLMGLGVQLMGAVTFGYNWVSLLSEVSYFSADQPELFRNLWSLAVEEQFYLLWPLALLLLLRIRHDRVRLALILLFAALSAAWMGALFTPSGDPTRAYYGSDSHSFGLLLGAALALVLRRSAGSRNRLRRLRPWLGGAALGLLCAAVWLLPSDSAATYRGGLLAVSLLTAVVIWAAVRGGRFGHALDVAPLRYLGERSYGIYLWHWPILVLMRLAWPPSLHSAVPIALATAALTLLAAAASYRFVEKPIRDQGLRRFAGRFAVRDGGSMPERAARGLGLMVALALCTATVAALLSAPATTTAQQEIARGQAALAAAERRAVGAEQAAALAAQAAMLPGGQSISAVGDSVMLASAAELEITFPGISIDAAVSRGMQPAADILSAAAQAGTLRSVVIVGLGTNGPVTTADLRAIKTAIGPTRRLILVNAFADRDWTPGVNTLLASFSAAKRSVVLADWHGAIAPRMDLLAQDRIHPGPLGGQIY